MQQPSSSADEESESERSTGVQEAPHVWLYNGWRACGEVAGDSPPFVASSLVSRRREEKRSKEANETKREGEEGGDHTKRSLTHTHSPRDVFA